MHDHCTAGQHPTSSDHNEIQGILQVVDLQAAPLSWEIGAGIVVHGYAFNGEMPGPTIEAQAGDVLAVRFTNLLPVPATIRWIGLPVGTQCPLKNVVSGLVGPAASVEYQLGLFCAGTFRYQLAGPVPRAECGHGFLIVADLESADLVSGAR